MEHPFVVQLGKGTLPQEAFTHFLRQGYIYLLHYARVYALAVYKGQNFDEIAASMTVVQNCIDEVKVNLRVSNSRSVSLDCLILKRFCSFVKRKGSQERSWNRRSRAMRVLHIVGIF